MITKSFTRSRALTVLAAVLAAVLLITATSCWELVLALVAMAVVVVALGWVAASVLPFVCWLDELVHHHHH